MSSSTVPPVTEDRTFPDVIKMLAEQVFDLSTRWFDLSADDRKVVARAVAEAGDDLRPALDLLRALPATQPEVTA